jgi:hypothetical protein
VSAKRETFGLASRGVGNHVVDDLDLKKLPRVSLTTFSKSPTATIRRLRTPSVIVITVRGKPHALLLSIDAARWLGMPLPRQIRLSLDESPVAFASTAFLRDSSSQRLDAKKMARFYGEPLGRFAEVLRVPVSKLCRRPDALELQPLLRRFEQAARIAPLLKKDSFSKWVRMPNSALHGSSPLQLLAGGIHGARKLLELVEDVIIGQPD